MKKIIIIILALLFIFLFGCNKAEVVVDNDEKAQVLEINYSEMSEIELLIYEKTNIIIPVETKITSHDNTVLYSVGIRNINHSPYFKIELMSEGIFIPIDDQENKYTLSCDDSKCNIQDYGSIDNNSIKYLIAREGIANIEHNKTEIIGIAMMASSEASKGHYIFNVKICSRDSSSDPCTFDNLYSGAPHKIHLIVK